MESNNLLNNKFNFEENIVLQNLKIQLIMMDGLILDYNEKKKGI